MCWIVALHASPTDNNIGSNGAKAFAEALKVNSTLTQLDVEGMFPAPNSKGVEQGRLADTPVGVGRCAYGALRP